MIVDLTKLKEGERPYEMFPVGKFSICPKCGRWGDVVEYPDGKSWFTLHVVEVPDPPLTGWIDEKDICEWGFKFEWKSKLAERAKSPECAGMTDEQIAEKFAKEFLSF